MEKYSIRQMFNSSYIRNVFYIFDIKRLKNKSIYLKKYFHQ